MLHSRRHFATGCTLPAGGGTFSCTSDRAAKTDFAPVDSGEILDRVIALPISEWRFSGEPSTVRHMGPVAQDFRAAFGLGYDDKSIGIQDAQGVALGVGLGVVPTCTSNDPLSMRSLRTRQKTGPRWSKKGGGVKFGSPVLMAGLPGNSAWVNVGPPLSCNGPSIGSVLIWSPGPVKKPPPSSLLTL